MKKLFYLVGGLLVGSILAIGGTVYGANPVTLPINGGTGSTTLSGILRGNGTSPIQTLLIGSGLTFNGTTLATNGTAASSTLLGDSNTFSGTLNTFTNAPKLGALSGVIYGNAGVLNTQATSTGTVSSPLTGNFICLGSGCTLGIQAASASVTGALTGTDWTTFNNKISSSSLSASFPLAYNSSTGVFTSSFSTTTTWGLGNNGIVVMGASGIPFVSASSSLSLPNTALQNSLITINGTNVSLGGSITVSSTTLLANSNTFGGTQTFTNAPVFSALTGILKGNGASALTVAANGTDYSLITALTCGAGQHFSAVTASGTFTCSADTGAGGTGLATSSPVSAGNVLVYSSAGAGSASGVATGTVSSGTGISVTAGQSIIGSGLTVTNTSPLSGLSASYPFSFSNPTLTWLGLSTTTNTGLSAGNLYIGSGGIMQTSASSSIFGYTPLNPTRALTFSSGNGQIVFSAGSQDLSADRTWTATYTGLATTSALTSSQLLVSNGLAGVYGVGTTTVTCSGTVSCTTFTTLGGTPITITGSASGGIGDPFTHPAAGQSATTSLMLSYGNASTTQFTATSTTYLAGSSGYVGIGTSSPGLFSSQRPLLTLDMTNQNTSEEGILVTGSVNDFLENNVWNRSNTANAQSCQTATASYGTNTTGFVSMCANSASFNNPQTYNVGNAGDLNLLAVGTNDFWIGNGTANKKLYLFAGGVATSSIRMTFDGSLGTAGLGTTTPQWLLQLATSTKPQLSLGDGTVTSAPWTFRSIAGSLFIATASPTTFATSTLPVLSLLSTGQVGIATSSPFSRFAIDTTSVISGWIFSIGSSVKTLFHTTSGGQTTTCETKVATSSVTTIDWVGTTAGTSCNKMVVGVGTSAMTIQFINATTSAEVGGNKLLTVCNPNGTAGALTFVGVEWAGATVPTQTTTANQCDVYSLYVTSATSTTNGTTASYKLFGGASTGYQ